MPGPEERQKAGSCPARTDEAFAATLRRVQANGRRNVPEGSDLAAELSEDRQREAADANSGPAPDRQS
jgi:hypothetical protein